MGGLLTFAVAGFRRDDALSFLTTCFPGNPLVVDILAGCDGDANAATAKLLELRDEEQAHDLAAAMQEAQELSAAPAQVWDFCTCCDAGYGMQMVLS